MALLQKILIANRGEIAVRIMKKARNMGIRSVAIYAADDVHSQHVSMADEAILLEGETLAETYLNQGKMIQLAIDSGASAIHPGYGFLSENAEFAEKVEQAGLAFIGATPEQIRLMGEKTQAIGHVKKLGMPVVPGLTGSVSDILSQREKLDFPVLVKASGGGGGKGMEVVHDLEHLPLALQQAQRQAQQYFGNQALFVEKYLPISRHIEVQVLGDGNGNVVHLFERECSIQRRYQKLVEEAPADSITDELRGKLHEAAVKIAASINYRGAGTIEFLVDEQDNFYFLEMNTRIQVEHPVTELITGIDLVEWQIKVAAGESFDLEQKKIPLHGHAIELRICAEDPANGFRPTSGIVREIQVPENSRWDSFLEKGSEISPLYDSLVGKLIVQAKSRAEALADMQHKVGHLHVSGVKTNQEFLYQLLLHPDFSHNSISTRWVEEQLEELTHSMKKKETIPPVVELVAGYLLHHFYRPPSQPSVWGQLAYRRIHEFFQVQVNEKMQQVGVLHKGEKLLLDWQKKSYELNNYQFRGSKIEFQINNEDIAIFISEEKHSTIVQLKSKQYELRSNHVIGQVQLNKAVGELLAVKANRVVADLFGKVVDVLIKPGDLLRKGQDLLVIESMKSEFTIQSPVDAVVKNIHVSKGKIVQDKQLLVDFES